MDLLRTSLPYVLWMLLGAWVVCVSEAEADDDGVPLFLLSADAPPGFEALARSQTALVDVYYGDRPLVSTMATYTPEAIEFDELDQLMAAIPDLINTPGVRAALTGSLASNSTRLCRGTRRSDCGTLEPDAAGVIFNADRYRVDLFVSSAYRTKAEPVLRRFIPPSNASFSFIQNLTGNFAGSDVGNDQVTIGSSSTLAWRENRVVALTSYSDTDALTIDRLFARRDFEGRQHVAGLFRTSGRVPSFTGENDLLGVRLASSLETRADLRQSRGTPIDVFLTSRGRVDIIKDGRLISTRFYDPGNQILDTTNLPDGAYDITVRVTEGGQVREETRFYTKSGFIPPRDQPLFTLEAGEVMLRNTQKLFPEDAGAWLVRGGYSRRLTDSFGFDAGVAGTSDDQLLESGIFLINTLPGVRDAYYELQTTAFGSVAGDFGYAFNGLLRYDRFTLNFDYREVAKKESLQPGFAAERFRLVPDDLRQASLSLQIPMGAGSIGVTASDNRRRGGESRSSQSVNFRYPLLRTRSGFLELRGDFSRTNGDYAAFLGVRFNFWRNKWTGTVAPSYQYADANLGIDDGPRVDGTASWYDPDSALGDLRLTADGSAGENVNRLGTSVDWQNFLGRTIASVEYADRGGQPTTSYSASLTTSALTDGEFWTFGGQNSMNSAVVIDLEGEAPDTDFVVLVDGYQRGYAPAGRATAVNLAPYRTYEVRISPRRANFVAFKDRIELVTLYPGNVRRLSWEISDLLVVVGRVEDQQGNPLVNAVVEAAHGIASTDQYGYFQAEILRPTAEGVLLDFRDARGLCRVLVVEYEERAGVGFLDTLVCRRVESQFALGEPTRVGDL